MCVIVTYRAWRDQLAAAGVQQRMDEEQIKGHDARVLARARALASILGGYRDLGAMVGRPRSPAPRRTPAGCSWHSGTSARVAGDIRT